MTKICQICLNTGTRTPSACKYSEVAFDDLVSFAGDRTGGYRDCATKLLNFAKKKRLPHLKVIFLNDRPGLLLGSMWADYAKLETNGRGRIRVVTLRMVSERLTADWLES